MRIYMCSDFILLWWGLDFFQPNSMDPNNCAEHHSSQSILWAGHSSSVRENFQINNECNFTTMQNFHCISSKKNVVVWVCLRKVNVKDLMKTTENWLSKQEFQNTVDFEIPVVGNQGIKKAPKACANKEWQEFRE